MFKGQCLHPQLSRIMKETGHTDLLCVCDAGFPIPKDVERVDLAWKQGEPAWLDVCRLFIDEMAIEKIYLAEEIKLENPSKLEYFMSIFPNCCLEFIPHTDFKQMSQSCRTVVRTGEFSSFCNLIIVAGVNF